VPAAVTPAHTITPIAAICALAPVFVPRLTF
jgi:hypothetical protein